MRVRKLGATTQTGDDEPFNGLIFVEKWFQHQGRGLVWRLSAAPANLRLERRVRAV